MFDGDLGYMNCRQPKSVPFDGADVASAGVGAQEPALVIHEADVVRAGGGGRAERVNCRLPQPSPPVSSTPPTLTNGRRKLLRDR